MDIKELASYIPTEDFREYATFFLWICLCWRSFTPAIRAFTVTVTSVRRRPKSMTGERRW